MKIEGRWSDDDEIAELMDVSTGACTGCKRPARVPEDVVAVLQVDGVLRPIIVCPECVPEWTEMMLNEMKRRFEDGND
jgi:hypothetical protein